MSLETAPTTQSWADLATLDDSRDGINLFMKHALQMGNSDCNSIEDDNTQNEKDKHLSPVKETKQAPPNAWGVAKPKPTEQIHKIFNAAPTSRRQKATWGDLGNSPWKAVLLGKSGADTARSSSDGIPALNRKRLACDITTTPTKRKEKKAGVKASEASLESDMKSNGHGTSRTLSFMDTVTAAGAPDAKPKNAWGIVPNTRTQGDQKKTRLTTVATATQPTVAAKDVKPRTWASLLKPEGTETDEGKESDDGVHGNSTDPSQGTNAKKYPVQPVEELTAGRVEKRQRQIDIGKSTEGYQRYIAAVPKSERRAMRKAKGMFVCPSTPEKTEKISKRAWDAQVRRWRRSLHEWDPPTEGGNDAHEPETRKQQQHEAEGDACHSPVQKALFTNVSKVKGLRPLISTITPIRTTGGTGQQHKESSHNAQGGGDETETCLEPPKVVRVAGGTI